MVIELRRITWHVGRRRSSCRRRCSGPTIPGRYVPGDSYAAGRSVFVERTTEWKLDQAAVNGNRITLGDIDGDGYADLVVRKSGVRADVLDEAQGIRRHHWVLRNRGNAFQDVTDQTGVFEPRGQYPLRLGRPVKSLCLVTSTMMAIWISICRYARGCGIGTRRN